MSVNHMKFIVLMSICFEEAANNENYTKIELSWNIVLEWSILAIITDLNSVQTQ